MVPEGIVVGGRIACVEPGLSQLPTLVFANTFRQRFRIVVGIPMAESGFGCVEEILAVEEDDCSFDGGF